MPFIKTVFWSNKAPLHRYRATGMGKRDKKGMGKTNMGQGTCDNGHGTRDMGQGIRDIILRT